MFDNNFNMSTDDFVLNAHKLADWITKYYKNIESYPVLSQVKPGDIKNSLPREAPLHPESFNTILNDFDKLIMPGLTHWQSPNFFAFFPSNTSFPSILGEFLTAALGVQGMMWATSPACTELETHLMDWLVDMLGLPFKFKSSESGGGVIQDSASGSALCAVIAARERITNFNSNETGLRDKIIAYTSYHAHSSIEKAIKIAGIGRQNLRFIDCDQDYRMDPQSLENRILEDISNGCIPFFVSATIGTTSSNAIDPIKSIGKICRQHNLWFHVDGAMSGTAALCPEHRYINDGLEYADSYNFNPHKWMFTNFDCNCFYISNKLSLTNALGIMPEYLRNKSTESGEVIDYRDWQIPLGRRFRSLKLWFVIRCYGIDGLRYHIRKHIDMAQNLAQWIKNSDEFEVVAPVPLNLICFRHVNGDEFNEKLLDRINKSGKIYMTHTKLDGKYTLRLCVGQTDTDYSHIKNAWELIQVFSKE